VPPPRRRGCVLRGYLRQVRQASPDRGRSALAVPSRYRRGPPGLPWSGRSEGSACPSGS
jgi:hypothetical protein